MQFYNDDEFKIEEKESKDENEWSKQRKDEKCIKLHLPSSFVVHNSY